jgi:hypothetical protein
MRKEHNIVISVIFINYLKACDRVLEINCGRYGRKGLLEAP